MRPLKPLVVALSSVFAAVFGAIFFGSPPATTPATVADGRSHDLQAKRTTTTAATPELGASRDSRPNDKTSGSQPHFPAKDFSRHELFQLTRAIAARPLPGAPERMNDRRLSLLVGVVELRI